MYVNDVKSGTTCADASPHVLKETVATAFVDGANALGKEFLEVAVPRAL